MDVVVVRNLDKVFSRGAAARPALRKVSLTIPAGGITALIGPDGAGKTTLLRTLAGILSPTRGDIRVLGNTLPAQALAVQARIGYMPQRFGLYEDLTVEENFSLFASLRGLAYEKRAERFAELLTLTALGPFRARRAGQLSGGMKQKLGLACTLIHPPELLLLDEASVGVDPISRRELWNIIEHQVRDQGVTVVLSTAYMDEAERCNQIVLLHQGEIMAQGTPADLAAPLRGHIFMITEATLAPRALQSRLAHVPGIVDTAIRGDGLRIVTQQPAPPPLPPDIAPLGSPQPVAPHLEDAFVSMLFQRSSIRPLRLATSQSASSSSDEPVVEVKNLSRNFGNFTAVNNISFSVRKGEVFGLLGANGAGKSTTFRMLCGLLPPTAGTLLVAGMDLRRAPAAARARIGYVSQRFSLYAQLSVQQNLAFFASAYGLNGERRQRRMDWALEELDLRPYAGTNAGNLPLGFKQRLALACALMHEPTILFLDEPTSGVDPLARREFWARLNALAESGTTCLVTTHFMEEAEYCDRLVLMSLGEILAQGRPAELRRAVRRPDLPSPNMEDAFIALIEEHERATRRAS